jgi:hypothetical protein
MEFYSPISSILKIRVRIKDVCRKIMLYRIVALFYKMG